MEKATVVMHMYEELYHRAPVKTSTAYILSSMEKATVVMHMYEELYHRAPVKTSTAYILSSMEKTFPNSSREITPSMKSPL